MTEINSLATIIAAATWEQSIAQTEINTVINQMDQVTEQNAALAEESTAAGATLSHQAEQLSRRVSIF